MGMSLIINWLKLIGYAAGAILNLRGLHKSMGNGELKAQSRRTINLTLEFIQQYGWIGALIVFAVWSGFTIVWPEGAVTVNQFIASEHCKITLDSTIAAQTNKIEVSNNEQGCTLGLELKGVDVRKVINLLE